jgi:uncharacterized protein (DUF433 family)
MVTVLSIDTIVSDTAVRNGQPIIAGTQVRVTDLIASHLFRGHTPEALAVNYSLGLGQVYAALAYYYQHKREIDDLLQQEEHRADTYLTRLEHDGRLLRVE